MFVGTPRSIRTSLAIAAVYLFGSVVLIVIAGGSKALAAEDIQQINLGQYAFYFPKAWMKDGLVVAYNRPSGRVQEPQPNPIEARDLSIRPWWGWKPYGKAELPDLIRLSHAAPRTGRPPLNPEIKKWIEEAPSLKEDSDGFARVAVGFTKPGEQPAWEKFLYKGYANKLGEPLVVDSNNVETPFGQHYPSSVTISLEDDLDLQYRFENKVFPESAWWPLYQRTLAFIDFLRMPK
jgi:hypothetical protein